MERRSALKLPVIGIEDSFVKVVKKLSFSIIEVITISSSFEGLRTTTAGNGLRELVEHLADTVDNPAIVHALLTLKWHFSTMEPTVDDRGLSTTRANACEIIAWRFLSRLSERDILDFCLYELPSTGSKQHSSSSSHASQCGSNCNCDDVGERSALLPQFRPTARTDRNLNRPVSQKQEIMRSVSAIETYLADDQDEEEGEPTTSFAGLNALEIAAVADAKQFLSQRTVQKVINGIWCGDITFWGSLSVHTKKKAQFYNKKKADPYSRLRVPRYIKLFEVLFFAAFLGLYYAVLAQRNSAKITPLGVLLYVWIAAFAYDELSEFWDAGSLFYAVDFWNAWDLCIITVGAASFVTRVVGLLKHDDQIIDTAFDILSLEALFLVPRICSLLSLHPYFGTLIPCLKQMTKDFVKFMSVVVILYLGFLTTFIMLARDRFKPSEMAWILVKVFFGSSYLGFEIMTDISPILGPPLMLVFVCLTTILLITSLISILSASFANVTGHAREEYLFVYSVYVLEASTSNRLTHFYPPLNLIPLFLLRPLRLFVSSETLRAARIMLLKVTHTPIVGLIWLIEIFNHETQNGGKYVSSSSASSTIGPRPTSGGPPGKKPQRPFLVDRCSTIKRSSEVFLGSPQDSGFVDDVESPVKEAGSASSKVWGRKEGVRGSESEMREGQKSLEKKVDELTARVAELTSLMLAQQARDTGTVAQEDD